MSIDVIESTVLKTNLSLHDNVLQSDQIIFHSRVCDKAAGVVPLATLNCDTTRI